MLFELFAHHNMNICNFDLQILWYSCGTLENKLISEKLKAMSPCFCRSEHRGCWFYTDVVALAHEGKESREKRTRPQLLMARLMQPIPMMFITTPVLACRGRSTVSMTGVKQGVI